MNSLVESYIGRIIVDALKQAITKAESFGFELDEACMAADGFFPFSDSVEIAYQAGIRYVAHSGGSKHDNESITFCNKKGMVMVFTGLRHYKH